MIIQTTLNNKWNAYRPEEEERECLYMNAGNRPSSRSNSIEETEPEVELEEEVYATVELSRDSRIKGNTVGVNRELNGETIYSIMD